MNELPLEILLYISELDQKTYYRMIRTVPDVGRYALARPQWGIDLREKWTVVNDDTVIDVGEISEEFHCLAICSTLLLLLVITSIFLFVV